MTFQKVILLSYYVVLLLSYIATWVVAANLCYPLINNITNDTAFFAYPMTFIAAILISGIASKIIWWPIEHCVNSIQAPRVNSFLKSRAEDGDWQTTAKFLLFNRGFLQIADVGGSLNPTRWPPDALGGFFAKNKLVADQFYRPHWEYHPDGHFRGHESEPEDINVSARRELRSVDQSSGRFASKMESIKLKVDDDETNERLEKRKAAFERDLKRNNRRKKLAVDDINQRTEIIRQLPEFIFSEIQQTLEIRAQSGELLPIIWDLSSKFKGIVPQLHTLEINGTFVDDAYLFNETQANYDQKIEVSWFTENWLNSNSRSELQDLLEELELGLSIYFASSDETPERNYGIKIQIIDFKKADGRLNYVQFNTGLYGGRKKDKPSIKPLN